MAMTFIYQSFVHSCGNVKQNIYIYFTLSKKFIYFTNPFLKYIPHSNLYLQYSILKREMLISILRCLLKFPYMGLILKKKVVKKNAKIAVVNGHNPIKNNFLSQFLTQ